MNKQFTIEPLTLEKINFSLNVPAYQRPYCWGKEEIEKLLNDFKDNNQEDIYYIGNVITIKNNDVFDLIDGQQRMTTLWILSLYLCQYHISTIDFCKINEESRLNFAIRKQTNNYLEDILKQNITDKFWVIDKYLPIENKNNDPSIFQNENIKHAFNIIDDWFRENFNENNNNEANTFAQFIYQKVTFQFLTAPQNTDENMLFIQINTNGTQFQHADILKAELLNAIDKEEEKAFYAALWDHIALSYYEKSIKKSEVIVRDELFEGNLFNLIDEATEQLYIKENEKDEQLSNYRYEYIINFNTLLIHSLFIYCKKYHVETPELFNAEKLLDIFNSFRESINKDANDRYKNAINFLTLLETIKKTIDDHFIFRDKIDNTFVFIPEEYKSKKEENEDSIVNSQITTDRLTLAQFLRMLYHSNNDNKHYWMGIFINEYINNKEVNIGYLEKLENWISLNGRNFDTYFEYFNHTTDSEIIVPKNIPVETFSFGKISRYWFYKLEYLLWKKDKEIDKYIISRTSVEHTLPQKEKEYFKTHGINIDVFGNLILITVSENSGFSYKNILEKYNYYKGLTNPPYKMKLLFETLYSKKLVKDKLSDEELKNLKIVLKQHEKEMTVKLELHYIA